MKEALYNFVVHAIKRLFKIKDLTLFVRHKKQNFEKLIYYKKYNVNDIARLLEEMGVPRGKPIMLHVAMHNFYNFRGTANELIDGLIDYVGPQGTLCMSSFPPDKYNTDVVFDVKKTKSAAGYLTEVFRNREGVKRSINHLHSVCAYGKDAELIVNSHHKSKICFDELSPFYIIGELGGYALSLGMPKWYVGTGEHVCEALLYEKLSFFNDLFTKELVFSNRDSDGNLISQKMLTIPKHTYRRTTSTKLFDKYFSKDKYSRTKLSNIWISAFEMKYLRDRLAELALNGLTIYSKPKFYK